ncbi:MAG: cysteine desulfurase [Patescibacteria group bacterium]
MFDVQKVRGDFQFFSLNPELVYIDNAATTHKPKVVIDSLVNYYTKSNSNVHRGTYASALATTHNYENSRKAVQGFLSAKSSEEIIFTKGTTDSINLVAQSLISSINPSSVGTKSGLGECILKAGDEILLSQMEHHANIVPWQIISKKYQLTIKYIPLDANLNLDLQEYKKLLNPKVKLVSLCHVSNTLGIINPIKKITELAHQNGSLVLVDGAQAVGHMKVSVEQLDVDFYCYSGHKVYSPTGVGVLYGKKSYLIKMPPVAGGGDMIESVDYFNTDFNQLPYKFEPGTPNIAGVIGLNQGIKYYQNILDDSLVNYENQLLKHLHNELSRLSKVKLIAGTNQKLPIQSFTVNGVHPQDLDFYLASKNVCIRTGYHCTQPLLDMLGYENGVCRVSLAMYNTAEEVDQFIFWLKKGMEILA